MPTEYGWARISPAHRFGWVRYRPAISDLIRYSSSKPTCTTPVCERVLSMWSTRQGFCTTLQTRVRHSRAWCALHARAGSLFLAYTTRSHAFPSGPGASSLGCLDTDSSRVIRCCATERASQRGARHGYGTNINIPRSTVTRWPRSRAGLPKMVSNTCARTQAQCCVRTWRSCSLPLQTTGFLRAGWRSLDGLGLWGTRVAFSLPSVGALTQPQDDVLARRLSGAAETSPEWRATRSAPG